MTAHSYTVTANDQRAHLVLSGDWGKTELIRGRAAQWYERLGIDGSRVATGRLHPIAEYAANCAFLNESVSPDIEQYLAEAPTLEFPADAPEAWEFTESPEDRALRAVIVPRLGTKSPIRPTDASLLAKLRDAVRLLLDVLPALGPDALSYTRRHVLVRSDRMIGRTWVDIGGLTVSGDPALVSVAQLAESLYHEALHTKYYTIERGLRIPVPDEENSPTPVTIPWQQDSPGVAQQWTAHRALDAYYVYVHLGIFRLALLGATRSSEDLERLRRVCFRAAYLSHQLTSVCTSTLDEERRDMASWLGKCRVPEFDLNDAGEELLTEARSGPVPVNRDPVKL